MLNFRKESTKSGYVSALRNFKKLMNIEDLRTYLQSNPDVDNDIKQYLNKLEGKPPKTIAHYSNTVKLFLEEHEHPITPKTWKNLRRRGHYPRRIKPQTQDKAPTKQQIKKLLDYTVDIKAKALFLFLASSGCRVDEALNLEIDDLNLENNPPSAFIRAETTKGGYGERTVYFSNEAKEMLENWLAVKDVTKKRDGKLCDGKLLFPFTTMTARNMWNRAIRKAGMGQRDKRTQRHIYHIHGLRKFFKTKIGLQYEMSEALLGHTNGLDQSYVRFSKKEIETEYLKAMNNVSIYTIEDSEVKQYLQTKTAEIEDLKKKMEQQTEQLKKQNNDLKQQLNGQRPEMLKLREELDDLRKMLKKIVKQED